MGDNLTILGRNYTNVVGIKATQTNNGQLAYIRPTGTYNISSNGTENVAQYEYVDVDVQFTPNLEDRTVNYTPSASAQSDTVTQTDPGYDGLGEVTVNIAAMPAGIEGTPTVQISKSSGVATITPSVTNSAGYIAAAAPIAGTPVQVTGAELATGTLTISQSGETNVAGYEKVSVPLRVPGNSSDSEYYTSSGVRKWRYRPKTTITQSGWVNNGTVNGFWVSFDAIQTGTTVTPSTSSQIIGAADTMLEGAITVEAMPSGSASTPATTITANPTISIDANGLITSTASATQSITPSVSAGYVANGTAGTVSVSGSATHQLTKRTYSDISEDNTGVVDIPAGYYPNAISFDTDNGSVSTPEITAVPGTGHSVVLTPMVSFTRGWIDNGSKIGSDVTISASNLVSGNKAITSNGTDIDVTDYETVSVNVQPTLQSKSQSYTPTESAQSATISPDQGYDGLSSVSVSVGAISSSYVGSGVDRRDSTDLTASGATVSVPSGYYESNASKAIGNGTATAPASIAANSASIVIAQILGSPRLGFSKTVSVTPSVTTAGYIENGTAGNSDVTLFSDIIPKAAATYHPSTTDQSIASGTYLSGAQTIKAVTLANLTAGNIKKDVVVKIGDSTDDDCVASVTGTYEGGGASKNVQILQSTTRAASSTYTKICGDITVAKTGTYDVYWSGFRSTTSGTSGSQLYIGNTAYGSAHTSFTNHVQNVHLSNVSLTANQKISVYGRSRGSNYYMYVGELIIIER